ncbi:hypothetical protein [Cellulomonas cellasea]|uniref:hypothetical protein n=1 Tax=Cellulomonas cellasea TaxID=43670 RepID=UPI0012F96245|nr:hypothetical protein [Cellulomonas cellasea]
MNGARRATAWLAVLLVVPVAGAAPAAASPDPGPTGGYGDGGYGDGVECGDVLTGEHRLTRDLVCAGVGLTLEGTATLDLAGHTLDGGGSGVAFLRTQGPGTGDGSARVHDGVVRGWDHGVREAVGGTTWGNDVERVTFEEVVTVFQNEEPYPGGMTVSMRDSEVTGADVVFALGWSSALQVSGSRLERNDAVAEGGWGDYAFVDCVLVGNPQLVPGSGSQLTLVGNDVRGTHEVVGSGWATATLTGNTFVDNGAVVAGTPLARVVHGNTFEGNRLGVGARGRHRPESPGAWDGPTEVAGNTFVGNHDAIWTSRGADVRLGENVVTRSSGWGIRAPGARDLGGNRAWDNAREPQCTGVVCLGRAS